MWDPAQYERFRDERRRPFDDLVARVPELQPELVVDLGCGTGEGTLALSRRWPDADVIGIDGAESMVARARRLAAPARVRFEVADLLQWTPRRAPGLLVSNAVLHWVPDHRSVLARLAGWFRPGGVLAFQVPASFGEPSHRRVEEVRALPRFRDALVGVRRGHAEPLEAYEGWLAELGFEVDAWETAYLHLLEGEDPVLEWLTGTTLRPILSALGPAEGRAFSDALRPLLRSEYPSSERGTPFLFRRRFVVGRRRGGAGARCRSTCAR